jgi:hypothetical protein
VHVNGDTMRSALHLTRTICLWALVFLACSNTMYSQRSQLVEGLEFVVGFIHPERAPGEPNSSNAYQLILSSTVGAIATIGGERVVTIAPGTAEVVIIDSCDIIRVESDRPIVVSSRILMSGNGEQTTHIPTYAWDTSYYGFSWWTDRYGLDIKTYSTGKRLVIARENGTRITYHVDGFVEAIELDSGEYAYLSVPLDTMESRNRLSDPTSDRITASKPIYVISGHPKVALVNHPDAYPATGPYARALTRSRGTLMEAMIPVSMAGNWFITAPFQYSPTRKRGLDSSADNASTDRGDVVRFVATEDGTVLSHRDATGTYVVGVFTAGSVHTQLVTEGVNEWHASKPVVCVQYGKSYAHITSQATLPEDDPSTDAGLPMMMCIPSMDRWIQRSIISVPEGLFSIITVVTQPEHIKHIMLNGKPMYTRARVESLASTEMVLRYMAQPGTHTITASDTGARFMAYTYGTADGLDLCQAYASNTGFDLSMPCNDSVVFTTTYDGDTASCTLIATSQDTCSAQGVAMKYVANSFNCHISKLPNGFVINRVDQLDSAFAEIVVVTRSGRQHNERVEFALTSVASDIHSKSITVRPIPASEQLLVTLPENTNTTALSTIRLYSHIGALALQSLAQGNELSFDVRGLATGTYALQVGSSFIPVLIVR